MLFSEQVRAAASSGSSTPVLPKGIKDLNGGFHGSPRSATTNTTGLFMLTAGHKCSNAVLKHRWRWKDQEDARDQTRFKGGMRRGHFVEYRCPRRCQNKEDDKTKKNKEAAVSIRPCDVVVMSSTKPHGLCSMEVVIWKTYRRNWKGSGERTITEQKRREAPRSRYVAVAELMHPQAHFPNGLVQVVTCQEIQWEWTEWLHIAGVTGQNGAYEALRKTVRLEGLAALMGNCKSVPSPLGFMKSKRVLLAHELSLFGGPLLSMELAFLLRSVGAEVGWIIVRKPAATDEVLYSLEHKMLVREGKVFLGRGYWVFDPGGERNLQGGGRRNGENKQVEMCKRVNASHILKTPCYEMEMPIRCALLDITLTQTIQKDLLAASFFTHTLWARCLKTGEYYNRWILIRLDQSSWKLEERTRVLLVGYSS
jgi:hypothetical protein